MSLCLRGPIRRVLVCIVCISAFVSCSTNKNDLRGELGDLLFQVVFHARMAEESALFSFDDVVAGICELLALPDQVWRVAGWVLVLLSAYVAVGNWTIIAGWMLPDVRNASLIPLVGGLLGSIGISFLQHVGYDVWIGWPWVLDPGSLLSIPFLVWILVEAVWGWSPRP